MPSVTPGPAGALGAVRVIDGVASTVTFALIVVPSASVTVMVTMPAGVVALMTAATFPGMLPSASVATVVVFSVVTVLNQFTLVPFSVKDNADEPAKPDPLIVTVETVEALRAVGSKKICGVIVYVAVAEAPEVWPIRVIVCAPAAAPTGMR